MKSQVKTLISLGSFIRVGKNIPTKVLNIDSKVIFLVEKKHENYYQGVKFDNKFTYLIKSNYIHEYSNIDKLKINKIINIVFPVLFCIFLYVYRPVSVDARLRDTDGLMSP